MLSQRLLSRRLFIKLSNNRLKNWTKKELFKVSTHLKLNSNKNLTNKQMFNNIKQFYNIEPKVLIQDWKVEELKKTLRKNNLSVVGNKQKLFDKLKNLNLKKKKLNFLHIVSHYEQGKREYMEDRIIIRYKNGKCFLSILDGHGGNMCADFLKENLYKIFILKYKQNKGQNIKNILLNTYSLTDKLFLKKKLHSGSTACTLYINTKKKKFYVANTGDSRIIALINNKVVQLSVDHKPDNPKEKNRIYKYGGFVHNSRLNGILAMSRSMGDINLKKKGLTYYPDIISGDMDKIRYFVIASDGLYDVMSNYDIINFIQFCLQSGIKKNNIVKKLVKYSIIKKGSSDNVSAIIVFL